VRDGGAFGAAKTLQCSFFCLERPRATARAAWLYISARSQCAVTQGDWRLCAAQGLQIERDQALYESIYIGAWLMIIFGASPFGSGFFGANGDTAADDGAALAAGYLGHSTGGEAIDRGVCVVFLGITVAVFFAEPAKTSLPPRAA
jgi:hypothetical protein